VIRAIKHPHTITTTGVRHHPALPTDPSILVLLTPVRPVSSTRRRSIRLLERSVKYRLTCEASLYTVEDELDGEGGEKDAEDAGEDVGSGLAEQAHDSGSEEEGE
jgi:hypothetical protein